MSLGNDYKKPGDIDRNRNAISLMVHVIKADNVEIQ